MICLKCKQVIPKEQAIPHPKGEAKFYCPYCKRVIFDFGHEPVHISPQSTIEMYDHSERKPSQFHGESFYSGINVDVQILECKDAIANNVRNLDARLTLARLYLSRGDTDNALHEAKQILNYIRFDSEVFRLIADIYAAIEDFASAARYCVNLIKQNPLDVDARFKLAIAMLHLGNYSSAANQLKKVLQLDPGNPEALYAFEKLKSYLAA